MKSGTLAELFRGYNGTNVLGGLAILSMIFELVILLLVVWFLLRFVARVIGIRGQPAEPNDYAGVPVRIRPRPNSSAGAVVLMEPDENDEELKLPAPPSCLSR